MADQEDLNDMVQDVAKTIRDLQTSVALQHDLLNKLGESYFCAKFGLRLGDVLIDDIIGQKYSLIGFEWDHDEVVNGGLSIEDVECRVQVVMFRPDGNLGAIWKTLTSWRKEE